IRANAPMVYSSVSITKILGLRPFDYIIRYSITKITGLRPFDYIIRYSITKITGLCPFGLFCPLFYYKDFRATPLFLIHTFFLRRLRG
ncbi:hypothetical protein, partial [Anaerophaga thermohalophila]|uniref:hypothetical protein n=1 Tax=Anaerophaga thermohalophila TaxID=177400 RepID=UPI001C3FF933